jgi:hypothetical protein
VLDPILQKRIAAVLVEQVEQDAGENIRDRRIAMYIQWLTTSGSKVPVTNASRRR